MRRIRQCVKIGFVLLGAHELLLVLGDLFRKTRWAFDHVRYVADCQRIPLAYPYEIFGDSHFAALGIHESIPKKDEKLWNKLCIATIGEMRVDGPIVYGVSYENDHLLYFFVDTRNLKSVRFRTRSQLDEYLKCNQILVSELKDFITQWEDWWIVHDR